MITKLQIALIFLVSQVLFACGVGEVNNPVLGGTEKVDFESTQIDSSSVTRMMRTTLKHDSVQSDSSCQIEVKTKQDQSWLSVDLDLCHFLDTVTNHEAQIHFLDSWAWMNSNGIPFSQHDLSIDGMDANGRANYLLLFKAEDRIMPFLMEDRFFPGVYTGTMRIFEMSTENRICTRQFRAISSEEIDYWERDGHQAPLELMIKEDFVRNFQAAINDSLEVWFN